MIQLRFLTRQTEYAAIWHHFLFLFIIFREKGPVSVFKSLLGISEANGTFEAYIVVKYGKLAWNGFRKKYKEIDPGMATSMEEWFRALKRDCFNSGTCKSSKTRSSDYIDRQFNDIGRFFEYYKVDYQIFYTEQSSALIENALIGNKSSFFGKLSLLL